MRALWNTETDSGIYLANHICLLTVCKYQAVNIIVPGKSLYGWMSYSFYGRSVMFLFSGKFHHGHLQLVHYGMISQFCVSRI